MAAVMSEKKKLLYRCDGPHPTVNQTMVNFETVYLSKSLVFAEPHQQ